MINVDPAMSAGYVQSAMWHLVHTPHAYTMHMDSWRQVLVPPGHVIMWSVPRIRHTHMNNAMQQQGELSVYVGDESPSDLVWRGGGSVAPDPTMHNTPSVFVYFYQMSSITYLSFRMIFSFHKVSLKEY